MEIDYTQNDWASVFTTTEIFSKNFFKSIQIQDDFISNNHIATRLAKYHEAGIINLNLTDHPSESSILHPLSQMLIPTRKILSSN
jgi:hypothetical protein